MALTFKLSKAEYDAIRYSLTHMNLSIHQIAFAAGVHIDAVRLVGATPGLMRERADYVEEAYLEIQDRIRNGDQAGVVIVGRDIEF